MVPIALLGQSIQEEEAAGRGEKRDPGGPAGLCEVRQGWRCGGNAGCGGRALGSWEELAFSIPSCKELGDRLRKASFS